MNDVIKLTCSSCGGKLEITPDIDRFACGFCSTEQIVKRSGGIVSLSPVVDAIKKVELGVDKTSSELALVRLRAELTELISERETILSNSPRPSISYLIIIFTYFGIALFLVGLFSLLFKSGGELLLIGSMVSIVGIVMYVTNKGATRIWDREIGPEIKKIDKEITQKQMEIKHHHQLVSQK